MMDPRYRTFAAQHHRDLVPARPAHEVSRAHVIPGGDPDRFRIDAGLFGAGRSVVFHLHLAARATSTCRLLRRSLEPPDGVKVRLNGSVFLTVIFGHAG